MPTDDDVFAQITEGLVLDLDHSTVSAEADLDDELLIEVYAEVRSALVASGELLEQTTAEGRVFEARRQACIHQFIERGIRV